MFCIRFYKSTTLNTELNIKIYICVNPSPFNIYNVIAVFQDPSEKDIAIWTAPYSEY